MLARLHDSKWCAISLSLFATTNSFEKGVKIINIECDLPLLCRHDARLAGGDIMLSTCLIVYLYSFVCC